MYSIIILNKKRQEISGVLISILPKLNFNIARYEVGRYLKRLSELDNLELNNLKLNSEFVITDNHEAELASKLLSINNTSQLYHQIINDFKTIKYSL